MLIKHEVKIDGDEITETFEISGTVELIPLIGEDNDTVLIYDPKDKFPA